MILYPTEYKSPIYVFCMYKCINFLSFLICYKVVLFYPIQSNYFSLLKPANNMGRKYIWNQRYAFNKPITQFHFFYINIYQYSMISAQESLIDSLSNLSLAEILQKSDLNLDQIFAIKDILSKIKRQMKLFIDYCKINEDFTCRMIQLGLQTPIVENSNQELKNLVYVSTDILTSDHESVANLLIMAKDKHCYDSDDEGEIAQQIQTEENMHEVVDGDKYKYLNKILEYFENSHLEENCVNYNMKCLQTLVRKKYNAFLQFFGTNPLILEKIVHIAHFPSVCHFLAKLLTDDEDDMTTLAIEAKEKIIPLLLQKIHDQISQPRTLQVLQCIEEILNSSRYGDSQDRSILQKLSDAIVLQGQFIFHLKCIEDASCKPNQNSFNTIFNSVTYLNIVITRINMDSQNDYAEENKPYKPTLKYQQKSIFASFCKLIMMIDSISSFKSINQYSFKLLLVKFLELLITITKNIQFGQHYSLVSKEGRINAIKLLITNIANRQFSGIILQIGSSILEKIILSQEKISQSNPESPNKVSPSELYKLISEHYESLNAFINGLMHESVKQRNQNEQGIYSRKLLVVLDNFFKNKQIQKSFPEIETVSKLFPIFNLYNCKMFTDLTIVSKHPSYTKAKTPQEFVFIQRNRNFLNQIPIEEIQKSKDTVVKQEIFQQTPKKPKSQASQKNSDIESPQHPRQLQSPKTNEGYIKVDSPTRPQVAPQPCLIFFIRHLAIY